VLGAGAALGGAWTLGALTALAESEGYEPTTADVVLGTSAGSVLTALIGLKVPLNDMVERLGGGGSELEGTASVNPLDIRPDHVHRALGRIPRPVPLPASLTLAARTLVRPQRHTLMTLAAAFAPRGRGQLSPVRELIEDAAAGRDWPDRPRTWIVAMDATSGRRVVFGRPGGPEASLPDAVVASCSAPGYFPPAVIGGNSYVDGGAVSMTNADVLAREDLAHVLVLAPMCMRERDRVKSPVARVERRLREYANRRLRAEVARLLARGIDVRVIAPGADDLAAMGANVMDPTRRAAVFAAAVASTHDLLARIDGPAFAGGLTIPA
jgi:NTE family protein